MNLLQNKMLHIVNQNKKLEELATGTDHIKIRYEDFSDWDETMQRITRFLKVSRQQIEEGAKKLNPFHLEDMIENYGEVRDWLKDNYENFMN